MRILLTGATSFTGTWFARALASAGHTVVAAMRGAQAGYTGLRAERLSLLEGHCSLVWNQPFGGDAFVTTIEREGPFDILCHHASDATDYKSPGFDAFGAVTANCRELPRVLAKLKGGGCRRVVLTGSVFETGEGCGTAPLMAFSPYGLSKTLTVEAFRYFAAREGMALGKFVIANPFGPYEELRFTKYLMNCWREGRTARVNTPDYVRDNIPVSLMALAYADFAVALPHTGFHKFNPSYYAESQGAFAARFARESGARLGIATPLELAVQTDFAEPLVRINTDRIAIDATRWQESAAWDGVAGYYRATFAAAA
jgi:UDP-glucose 4-epimerase